MGQHDPHRDASSPSRQPYDSDASTHTPWRRNTMRINDIRLKDTRPATLTRVLSRVTRRRALTRELADFSTAAERLELETLLDAQPDDATREVRAILARQAA